MKTLTVEEMRVIDGGFSTKCPVCGGKVSVSIVKFILFGKKAYEDARFTAQAQHWSYRTGYKKKVRHY